MTHVLMIYPGMIPSVLLCGQMQFAYLAKLGRIEFCSIQRDALSAEDCGWADVAVFVRSDSEIETKIASKLKGAGKRIVYVMDDDLLCIPENVSSSIYYSLKDVKNNIHRLLSLCDVFMSPSEVLREKYGAGKAAAIEEPSSVDHKKSIRTDRSVRIGFAGSIDRADDFDVLLGSVVKSLLASYDDKISIEFLGAHPRVADECSVRCIPYCSSYDVYQRTIESLAWDIGLAPMPETSFHMCKHYIKFVEYAGFGIAGVYSNTIPYTRIVRNEVNGLLCDNTPEAWVAAISRLIEDDTLRERITHNAQLQAAIQFSVEATAFAMEKELGDILAYTAPNHQSIKISQWLRVKVLLRRGWRALRRYGLRLPVVAIQKITERLTKRDISA